MLTFQLNVCPVCYFYKNGSATNELNVKYVVGIKLTSTAPNIMLSGYDNTANFLKVRVFM